jgi:hypothetical protein
MPLITIQFLINIDNIKITVLLKQSALEREKKEKGSLPSKVDEHNLQLKQPNAGLDLFFIVSTPVGLTTDCRIKPG